MPIYQPRDRNRALPERLLFTGQGARDLRTIIRSYLDTIEDLGEHVDNTDMPNESARELLRQFVDDQTPENKDGYFECLSAVPAGQNKLRERLILRGREVGKLRSMLRAMSVGYTPQDAQESALLNFLLRPRDTRQDLDRVA